MFINEENLVAKSQGLTVKQEEISSLCKSLARTCDDIAMKLRGSSLSETYRDLEEFFTNYSEQLQTVTYKYDYETKRYQADNEALEESIVNKLKGLMQVVSNPN